MYDTSQLDGIGSDGLKLEMIFGKYSSREMRPHFLGDRPGTFKQEVARVKSLQSELYKWNPEQPGTPLAQEIFELVAEALTRRRQSPVGLLLCVAFGSPLDEKKGVDFLFELHGAIVTVDITVKEYKSHKKANFLLRLSDIQDGSYRKIAEHIALKLLKKIERRRHKENKRFRRWWRH